MSRNSTLVLILALAPALPCAVLAAAAPAPKAETSVPAAKADSFATEVLASMDRRADPCQDFYRYACGGWLDTTELPSDQVRWARSFSVLRERNREIVRDLLEAAAAKPGPAGTDRWRIGTFYGSCMDEAAVEKAGLKPLDPWLEAIAAVKDTASLLELAGKLNRTGAEPFFGLGVIPDFKDPDTNLAVFIQGGLGLPDRDYYLSEDPKKQEILVAYEGHVARMLGLLGADGEAAASQAAAIVAFETRLAGASRPRAEMRIPERLYNKIDRAGLDELTPALPWGKFFAGIGHPAVVDINVATPEFFTALEKAVADTDLAVLRAYLRWNVINAHTGRLTEGVEAADFDFYGRTLSGQQENQPRWKRCVAATEDALGEAVGRLYVERQFPGDSKDKALAMIHDIEAAFETNLPHLGWMDDATRGRAKDKMLAIGNKIGYPDEWRDYSTMELRSGHYFANGVAAIELEVDRQARKIGGPVDEKEWGMTPQMVNAYYNPLINEIAFPAGILQPPFFHRDFPAAMNFGAIGAVVGHELTHGFDDQGRKFDPDGMLQEWWAPEVAEKFEERAQCVRDLYSSYEVEPGLRVQGDLTAGENIADIGGLKQSYDAFKRWQGRQGEAPGPAVQGLTDDQLFFVAYGQVWCALSTPEALRLQVTTDPHSPPRFRVIGAVSNHPAFAEAFACEAGAPMAPKDRCEVW